MATQTIAVPSAPLQFPQSVTETISQTELALLLSLRKRLEELEGRIATAEDSLKTRLESGAVVEPGALTAELKTNSRRNVSWKDVSKRLAERLKIDGDLYCARVLAATKPTRTVSLEVR
jgi:hypothetical protein